MKKHLTIITVLLILVSTLNAQDKNYTFTDPVEFIKGLGGGYFQNDMRLNGKQLKEIICSNDEACAKWKSSNGLFVVAMICAGAGGGMIGWYLGADGVVIEKNSSLLLGGIVLAAGGIGMGAVVDAQRRQALNIYNEGLKTSYVPHNYFKFNLALNKVAISYNF